MRASKVVAILALVTLAAAVLGVRGLLRDPNAPLLFAEGHGHWIGVDRAPDVVAHLDVESTCGYRRTFVVDAPLASAKLTFRAMKSADVIVDGQTVLKASDDETNWKEGLSGDLAPLLKPGRHELVILVHNSHGPASLLAFGDLPFLCTDTAWEASTDGATWVKTRLLDAPWPNEMARQFERADRSLLSVLPYLLPVFAAVFLASYFREQLLAPSMLRWILLGAWTALAINDIGKLPRILGFDLVFHEEYVRYIVEHQRVPLASEGWQMFQSPLYYLLSAPLCAFATRSFGEFGGVASLRVLPLLAGIAQVEICYRALRTVFPERRELQSFGLVLGSLLPMNLYISQYAGNEAPAGLCVAAVCLATIEVLRASGAPTRRQLVWIGIALGLGLLTKVSAVLMVAPVALVLFWRDRSPARFAKNLALVLGVAAVLSGWYFVRNYVELGSFVVGGWDPSRGLGWWQDPGYHTPIDLVRFGESLFHPVYASFNGFWDGVYCTLWTDGFLSGKPDPELAPPWNFGFLWSLVWLSLFPTLAILCGVATALFKPRESARSGVAFAALCLAIYLGAMLVMFLKVPYFSVTKATYTAGLAPAYAVLAAAGFALVARHKVARAVSFGLLASWAVAAYAAFFVT